jgi:hypothetical protein
MIEGILHAIGLCPDNLGHPDLLDFIVLHYNEFKSIFINIIRYLWGQ